MPCGLRDLFPCFCREQDAISAGLAERKKQLQKTIYILLLGTAECGKSTVLKQVGSEQLLLNLSFEKNLAKG